MATSGPDSRRASVASIRQPRRWRLHDRLSDTDEQRVIAQYQDGTTLRELVSEFDIGLTSLKRLLRERPVLGGIDLDAMAYALDRSAHEREVQLIAVTPVKRKRCVWKTSLLLRR